MAAYDGRWSSDHIRQLLMEMGVDAAMEASSSSSSSSSSSLFTSTGSSLRDMQGAALLADERSSGGGGIGDRQAAAELGRQLSFLSSASTTKDTTSFLPGMSSSSLTSSMTSSSSISGATTMSHADPARVFLRRRVLLLAVRRLQSAHQELLFHDAELALPRGSSSSGSGSSSGGSSGGGRGSGSYASESGAVEAVVSPVLNSSADAPRRFLNDGSSGGRDSAWLYVIIAGAVLSAAAFAFAIFWLFSAFSTKQKGKKGKGPTGPKSGARGDKLTRNRSIHDVDASGGQPPDPNAVPPVKKFSFMDIQTATDDFSAENTVEDMGHSSVFKAKGPEGEKWVVKRAKKMSGEVNVLFEKEVYFLQNILHKNLLPLIGYCNDENEQILVYPFIQNGPLSSWLRPEDDRPRLSMEQRLRAAVDISEAIEYLHNTCKPPIIHRDMRSDTMLLDENFQVKVGGLGLMKHLPGEPMRIRIARRKAYLDPEYFQVFRITQKCDIFSFGVIMLEMITGKGPISENEDAAAGGKPSRKHIFLSQWAVKKFGSGTIEDILDPSLESCDKEQMTIFAHIATRCVTTTRKNRPDIAQIALWLKELSLSNEGWKASKALEEIKHG